MTRHALPLAALLAAAFFLSGCSSLYFDTMGVLGKSKREILVSRVDKARASQEQAREQFVVNHELFRAVPQSSERNLVGQYKALRRETKRTNSRADEVRKRIASVESVANSLFRDWEKDQARLRNPSYAGASERSLAETRQRYDAMMQVMRRAEEAMGPALDDYHDAVIFLRHNLTLRAVASLDANLAETEQHTRTLVLELERSIEEADRFLDELAIERK